MRNSKSRFFVGAGAREAIDDTGGSHKEYTFINLEPRALPTLEILTRTNAEVRVLGV